MNMNETSSGAPMDHNHNHCTHFDGDFSKPYHYGHGAYLGHIVPGYFFLIWAIWWTIGVYVLYFQRLGSRRQYVARGWFSWPCKPDILKRLPLEPIFKLVLPFFGINGELWMGHESWRNLYAANGTFVVDNINDWQHSCMYFAFMLSGFVDLLGVRKPLPNGVEQAFVALAFLSEGLLLVFHLKGPELEIVLHILLVVSIFLTVVVTLAEIAHPNNVILSLTRCGTVLLQGCWWIQVGTMMFTGQRQWHPCYMGSAMFAPVYFTMTMLMVALLLVVGFVVADYIHEKVSCSGPRYHKLGDEGLRVHHHNGDQSGDASLEMGSLSKD